MAPNPMVRAGVEVLVAHVAVIPLLAAAVETEVTTLEVLVKQVENTGPTLLEQTIRLDVVVL